jgi:hypothetical protein
MAFWSANDVEPTRQFRFKIQTGNPQTADASDNWWWAKSVTKPSFSINESQYNLLNHKFKYPGIVTWNDVTITMVDIGHVAKQWHMMLENSGYTPPINLDGEADRNTSYQGVEKERMSKHFGEYIKIFQLDKAGNAIETWTLRNPRVNSLNFGSLDYSIDDLVTIEIVIGYDWADLESNLT